MGGPLPPTAMRRPAPRGSRTSRGFVPWDAIKDRELSQSLNLCELERLQGNALLENSAAFRKAKAGDRAPRAVPKMPDRERAMQLHATYAADVSFAATDVQHPTCSSSSSPEPQVTPPAVSASTPSSPELQTNTISSAFKALTTPVSGPSAMVAAADAAAASTPPPMRGDSESTEVEWLELARSVGKLERRLALDQSLSWLRIEVVTTDEAIRASWPLMVQLRPAIDEADYVSQVRRQREAGYTLIAAFSGAQMVGLAGFVTGEKLAWGRYLYVDDLVTDEGHRSQGVGLAMISWLETHARELGCTSLHLDSANHRIDSHRFYRREGLEDRSLHFVKLNLQDVAVM